MQKVSDEYVESMKSIGRNRGYLKITIGIINSEAQENITTDQSSLTYFSNESVLYGVPVTQPYATCEENYSKVDGSMYFLPAEDSGATFYVNGIVSKDINGSISFTFKNGGVYDVAGFIIDFGDNYPVDFTISNGQETLTFTDNDKRYFTTEQGLHDISTLTITASKMLDGQTRLRIYSLSLGVSNTFTNETILNYTQTDYVSPIAESLPSSDISFTVENYDQYYNPDNPNSVLAFFEVGQEVKVQFGYDTLDDGNIEWLPETVSHLKTWAATDRDATFTATDIFDYMSGIYYGGRYYQDGITLHDLAIDVIENAGIESYKLDASLDDIVVHNPLPAVDYTQALQIIANAARCTLREDREGKIYIESVYIPDMTDFAITSNGETEYSNVQNIATQTAKTAFPLYSQDFTRLNDAGIVYMPDSVNPATVGYVSSEVSDENGDFNVHPTITIDVGMNYEAPIFNIKFRNVAPKAFTIYTYLGGEEVGTINATDPDLVYATEDGFEPFDVMVIEFTKGAPNSRVVIDSVWFGDPTDFTLQRNQFFDSPIATRQDRIKSISVSTFNYKESQDGKKTLTTTTISNATDDEYMLYPNNPAYGYEVEVVEGDADVVIVDDSAYAVTVMLSNVASTDVKLSLNGYEYAVDEQIYTYEHNVTGSEKTWSNPLISDNEHARKIEKWLADYFLGDIEYEIDWRGDPRLDADDLMNLELKTGEIVTVRGYQNTIDFGGAWSGHMKARKISKSEETIRTQVSPPTITADGLVYDGTEKFAIVGDYDESIMTVGGVLSGTDAGSYYATATLLDPEHYEWNNGTIGVRRIKWLIQKAPGTITLSKTTATVSKSSSVATVQVTEASGEVSVTSSDPSKIKVSISDGLITITGQKYALGTETVTVRVASTKNYAVATATITVTCSMLNLVSWSSGTIAEIADMLDAHYNGIIDIHDYWSVGDERSVSLSAMSAVNVGESHTAQTVVFVLLNAGGKELVNPINGITECAFVVGQKGTLGSGTTQQPGYMQSSATNYNGWVSSNRRTWCNNQYRNAIPATTRALFKQHYNYLSGNASATTYRQTADYFCLPSVKEILGAVGSANAGAEEKNEQLEYYKTSANRIKRISTSTTAASYWTSSKRYYQYDTTATYSYQFNLIGVNGTSSVAVANVNYGIAPQGVI